MKNNSENTNIIINADGFSIAGGETSERTISITGGNVEMTGTGTNSYDFPAKSGIVALTSDIVRQISLVANLAAAGDIGTINQTLLGIGYTGTISGWLMTCYPSATVTVDIWKRSGAVPTVSQTITASAKPNITAGQLNSSSTLTGWTAGVSPGDYFMLNVDSNNSATYINLQLIITQ